MHEGIDSLLRSLQPNPTLPLWMEPGSCLMMRKAIELGQEFDLSPPVLIATGQEWRRPTLPYLPSTTILPCFPRSAKLPNQEDWDQALTSFAHGILRQVPLPTLLQG